MDELQLGNNSRLTEFSEQSASSSILGQSYLAEAVSAEAHCSIETTHNHRRDLDQKLSPIKIKNLSNLATTSKDHFSSLENVPQKFSFDDVTPSFKPARDDVVDGVSDAPILESLILAFDLANSSQSLTSGHGSMEGSDVEMKSNFDSKDEESFDNKEMEVRVEDMILDYQRTIGQTNNFSYVLSRSRDEILSHIQNLKYQFTKFASFQR